MEKISFFPGSGVNYRLKQEWKSIWITALSFVNGLMVLAHCCLLPRIGKASYILCYYMQVPGIKKEGGPSGNFHDNQADLQQFPFSYTCLFCSQYFTH